MTKDEIKAYNFKCGKEQFINNLWHYGPEKPSGINPYKDKILAQFFKDTFIVVRAAQYEDILWERLIKWCYIDDILPDNE